jgi:hypothetical protein
MRVPREIMSLIALPGAADALFRGACRKALKQGTNPRPNRLK